MIRRAIREDSPVASRGQERGIGRDAPNPALKQEKQTQDLYTCVCFFHGDIVNALIPAEYITSVNLILDIVQYGIISVGYNGTTQVFELLKVINHKGTEEGTSIFKCGFVYNHLCALGPDTLHDTLYGTLAEIIRI